MNVRKGRRRGGEMSEKDGAAERDERTVRMRPEDLPDPGATRVVEPDATHAAATRAVPRVPSVDAAPPTTRLPERDGIDALSDPYFSPAAPEDLTVARPVVAIESPVESLPERRRRMPRWAIALLVALAVAAAATAAYLTYENELWGGRTVPEVVGMSEQDARAALEAAGFAVEVEYRAGDGDYGTVLSCDPAEGLRADPAAGVTLVVAGERTIPDVVGLAEEEATQALYDAGAANVQIARQNSDEPAGTVLAVDPAEGEPFVSTDTVTLTVAQPYAVPSLEGMGVDEALAALEEAGLAGTVSYVDSDAEKNTVVGSDPAAGTEVAGGSSVTLSVASPYPSSPAHLLEYFDLAPEALAGYLSEEGFSLVYGATQPSSGNAYAVFSGPQGESLQITDHPESGHHDGEGGGANMLERGAGVGGVRYAFSTATLPAGGASESEAGLRAVMGACGFEGLLDVCTQDEVMARVGATGDWHFVCGCGEQGDYTWVVRIGGYGSTTGVVAMVAPTSHFSGEDLSRFDGSVCQYAAYVDLFTG